MLKTQVSPLQLIASPPICHMLKTLFRRTVFAFKIDSLFLLMNLFLFMALFSLT